MVATWEALKNSQMALSYIQEHQTSVLKILLEEFFVGDPLVHSLIRKMLEDNFRNGEASSPSLLKLNRSTDFEFSEIIKQFFVQYYPKA